ncbi:hypothetical protein NP493_30g05026 [Ridgeia piscesae]|nr:hypothetical protein NP493_30g05026 [Ridgeia piscesae]
MLYSNSPHSVYFVGWSRERIIEEGMIANELRFGEASRYLSRLNRTETLSFYRSLQQQATVDMAIAVVSVKRTGVNGSVGYLTQVVTELDKIYKRDVNFRNVMFICNTFAGPGTHEEAENLARYFPVETRFPAGSTDETTTTTTTGNFSYDKEKQDYVYCMQKALQYPTKHVCILQDDAVPRPDTFAILKHVVETRVRTKHVADEAISRDWASVKLFYPGCWLGYELRNNRHHIELLSIGVAGGGLYLLATLSLGLFASDMPRLVYYRTLLRVGLYCILVCLAIGRQNVHAMQRLSKHFYSVWPAPECCIPATLFKAGPARDIARHLATVNCSRDLPLDIAMAAYTDAKNYASFLVQPNLITHIGLMSSLKGVSDNPEEFVFV